jgi:hypothetical protein
MKRIMGLIVMIIFAGTIAFFAVAQQKAEMPKNAQELKGKTKPEIMQIMATIVSPGLGVQCTFCHEMDFASDAKPEKVVARKMLKMMTEANENYFAEPKMKQVTCYMCHRGKEEPVASVGEMKEK